jgi:uroporphyrinogen decarboxylase
MNSLERIMATVTGADTDYQPFTMLLSLYGASLINANTTDFYRKPALWFEGQQKVVDTFDPDIVITPFSFPIEAEAFGSQLVFLEKYAPNIKKPIITDLQQIKNLQIPYINTSPALQFFLQSAGLICKHYKGNKAIAAPIHAPTDLPALLMGIEKWIDTLLFYPNEVALILEKTIEQFVQLGNEFFALGATFLVVPVNFTNPYIITDKIFTNLIPYLHKAFAQIKGPIVIHNGGCILKPFLDRYVKLPNVIAAVIDPREKLDEARAIIGNDLVLMGNFNGPNFVNLSKEQAVEKCLQILINRKDDKHFVFATSSADIPYETPVETIKAVVDTIRNFKKY